MKTNNIHLNRTYHKTKELHHYHRLCPKKMKLMSHAITLTRVNCF